MRALQPNVKCDAVSSPGGFCLMVSNQIHLLSANCTEHIATINLGKYLWIQLLAVPKKKNSIRGAFYCYELLWFHKYWLLLRVHIEICTHLTQTRLRSGTSQL